MVKIAAIGDNVVDCYVARGEMFPGGNCLNVSVFARRYGAQTAYIGAIGKDAAGAVIAQALRDEGVDISRLRWIDGPTAYCIIGHRNSDRVFESFDFGVSMFTPSQGDLDFLKGYDAVHVGQSSGLDSRIAAISSSARLSYDFSIRRDAAHRSKIGPLCFLASVSGSDLTQDEVTATGAELMGAGAKWVLVTRGRDGAVLFGADGRYAVRAAPTDTVDTLGAGDAFIARALYGLLTGEAVDELLSAAASAAAETCRYHGAVGHAAPLAISAAPPAMSEAIGRGAVLASRERSFRNPPLFP